MQKLQFDKYVVVQCIILLAILIATPYSQVNFHALGLVTGLILCAIGVWMTVLGVRQLGPALTPAVTPVPEGRLVTTGVYSIVRHPLYFSMILMAIGWSLFWGSLLALVFSVVLAVFFAFKASVEEKLLSEKYAEYAEYKARVINKIIPYIY